MKIHNISVMDLENSLIASAYPMQERVKGTYNINRARQLGSTPTGSGHDQYLTGIAVGFDLTCTIKMWVELERYRFVNFVSSQSTMHRIAKMPIKECCNEYVTPEAIENLNRCIDEYNTDKTPEAYLKVLYNVPTGFELTARLTTNYRALKTVYHQRKNHRLKEWREFCEWVETLPRFKELCLGGDENDN